MLSIAHQHGFFWETLWKLPANRELRLARKTPGQLVVGDRVTIPDREIKEVPAATDARHYFVKRGVPAKLRLVVEYEDMPVSNSDYVLVVDGSFERGTTDQQGLLEAFIPPNASGGSLEINGLHFELQLGALDPHSEDLGIQLRLANLGFYHGALDGLIGPQSRAAIATFQQRVGLPATGQLDDATRQMLLHRHDRIHEKLPQSNPDTAALPAETQNG
jgi:N-acetylmuramoyl-L-alanine amidase